MSVQTDLLGRYVYIPSEGDAGWVRAVWAAGSSRSHLMVFVERDNVSRDFKTYYAEHIVVPKETK